MQYFSYGSDKYSEIKMCDLEPFSKVRSQFNDAKVGIKSYRGARECISFLHVAMYVAICSYPAAIVCLSKLQSLANYSLLNSKSILYVRISVCM